MAGNIHRMRKILQYTLLAVALSAVVYSFYPETRLPAGTRIDQLVVEKKKRQMHAYAQGKLVKTYSVALGRQPTGHKQVQGDKKTPEGIYTINDKNPNSGYHKNLGVSYPNAKDRAYAARLGKSAGGDIKIHGMRNGLGFVGKWHRFINWTAGCIAVTDAEMDELYAAVKVGTSIEIRP